MLHSHTPYTELCGDTVLLSLILSQWWMQHTPLVWAEPRVCRWQDLLQLRCELVKFSGITREAVKLKIIFGLRICGLERDRKHYRSTLRILYINTYIIIERKIIEITKYTMRTLTGLPEALRVGESVAEDAFMPRASETMHNIPCLVQNNTLDLVFIFSSTVARLQRIMVTNLSKIFLMVCERDGV